MEYQTSSSAGSSTDSGSREQLARDTLREIALAFQTAVRGPFDATPLPPQTNEVNLSELRRLVAAYATAQRADGVAPEQVLVRIKAATRVLPTELSHDIAASARHTVLDAFLVGYYGDVGVRSRRGRAISNNV